MTTNGASPKKENDFIGLRSADLKKKVNDLVAANPGKVTASALIRAAIEEKLERIAAGKDTGVALRLPEGVAPGHNPADAARQLLEAHDKRASSKRQRKSS